MDEPEEMSAQDLVEKVIVEATSLKASLGNQEASGKDSLDGAIRLRILTGELCHRIVADRKEGKTRDA